MDFKERTEFVESKIKEAAKISGRKSEEITLIAVSKTKPTSDIKKILDIGLNHIGENYAQEASQKYEELTPYYPNLNLHFIGHLQSNKAKLIVPIAYLIHSVDSLSIAKSINNISQKHEKITNILLEVNISKDENKFGSSSDQVLFLAEQITEKFKNIKINGIMGMAPFLESKEETRPYFENLRLIFEKLPKNQQQYLSMGMTGDFYEAILEGSNMVRVGTAIFGSRNYL